MNLFKIKFTPEKKESLFDNELVRMWVASIVVVLCVGVLVSFISCVISIFKVVFQ